MLYQSGFIDYPSAKLSSVFLICKPFDLILYDKIYFCFVCCAGCVDVVRNIIQTVYFLFGS